ncbi:unnamed protein product [Paramecium pentaurelia]|uniref:Phosphoribosyltransferase domain-containing protein n=1 Tax=Paramecium pentaurelia TaxID=43138 RepID=A0A8S1YIL5_9CILI|nr:unnamed protein product [Paramecium pentaurelia]
MMQMKSNFLIKSRNSIFIRQYVLQVLFDLEIYTFLISGTSIGQILIQRNEETSIPKHFCEKFSKNINKQQVIQVEPILGTGGQASMHQKYYNIMGQRKNMFGQC